MGLGRVRSGVPAAVVVCVTLAATVLALKLWRADLDVPFAYSGDGNFAHMIVKGIDDHGWYEQNPSLGAPDGQQLYDYPVMNGDDLNAVVFWLLGLLAASATAMNLFYIATYPLAALAAFLVFRRLGLSIASAVVCSILYALLPYHLLRGEQHLLLAGYYSVPVAAWLALAVLGGEPLFAGRRSRTTLTTLLLCALVASASGSFYYSGFAIILVAAAAILAWRREALVAGALVIGAVLAVTLVELSPALVYRAVHGKNGEAFVRPRLSGEAYALKFTQLVLPTDVHRVGALARLTRKYEEKSPVPQTEAKTAALGVVGAVGFLWLLGVALWSVVRVAPRLPPLHRQAAALTVVAFLVATLGGLSTLITAAVPVLRAWNRLSIVIAFFALLAVGLLLDALRARMPALALAITAAVLVLGLLDQTSDRLVPAYGATDAAWKSDRSFVRSLESRLPDEGMVYQLPYMPFPEAGSIGRMSDYDHVKPYLHSSGLRWSYGAMRGRPADWAERFRNAPMSQLLPELRRRGFRGIEIDRFGYPDNGVGVEADLRRQLRESPLVSGDRRLSFFQLGR
jgi:phosphoglycerol transferase